MGAKTSDVLCFLSISILMIFLTCPLALITDSVFCGFVCFRHFFGQGIKKPRIMYSKHLLSRITTSCNQSVRLYSALPAPTTNPKIQATGVSYIVVSSYHRPTQNLVFFVNKKKGGWWKWTGWGILLFVQLNFCLDQLQKQDTNAWA